MKLLVVALVLALAASLGAYRDAQGEANSRQSTIALLSSRLSLLTSRVSQDERTASSVASNVSSICKYGKVVYEVSASTTGGCAGCSPAIAGSTTVIPQYVYC